MSISIIRYFATLLLLIPLILAGCISAPLRESLPTIADRLVAKDFAQILAQVDSLSPARSVLRMARPIGTSDTFDTALREELIAAGYVIEPINNDLITDNPTVHHTVFRTPRADSDELVYMLKVGDVSFRRGYEIGGDGSISPLTAMEAKGVDSSELSQDDSIFDTGGEVRVASVQQEKSSANTEPSQQLPEPIEEELIVIPPVVDASVTTSGENVLFNTRIVGESILTFDGDSLVLGEVNKRRVLSLVSSFESRTDVFSVLGCVFPEEIDWTEDAIELSINRAQRVQSELLYAGVPADKIRSETCAEYQDAAASGIPVSSVVLLLNRAKQ